MTVDKVLMPRRLTAENGAKSLLSGEFFVEWQDPHYCDCGVEGCEACELTEDEDLTPTQRVLVPWTMIKEIYATAVDQLKTEVLSMDAMQHAITALRALANAPCYRKNCGSVCLCSQCNARVALMTFDPDFIPRHTGRERQYVEQQRQVQHTQGSRQAAWDASKSTEAT